MFTYRHRRFPVVGDKVIYTHPSPFEHGKEVSVPWMHTFEVIEIDTSTGCVYLKPEDETEARRVLIRKMTAKFGVTDVLAYAWDKSRNLFAVNIEWDAWTRSTRPETPLKKPLVGDSLV